MRKHARACSDGDLMAIGGEYTAIQNPDGTWDVIDVPVMGRVKAGERNNEYDVGPKWMSAAIRTAAYRLEEQYLAPFHILHHDFGVTPKRAGFFLPKRVGEMRYEGKRIEAVFADLKSIPDRIFAKIDAGELPYLSVEVHDWDVAEINSLAALETEVPYFRFPLLTIGKKVKLNKGELKALVSPSGVAFFRTGSDDMAHRVDPANLKSTPDYSKAGGDGFFQTEDPEETVAVEEPEAKLEGETCPPEGVLQEEPEEEVKLQAEEEPEVEMQAEMAPPWAMELLTKLDTILRLMEGNSGLDEGDSAEQSAPVEVEGEVPYGPNLEEEERPPMMRNRFAKIRKRARERRKEATAAAKLHAEQAKLRGEKEAIGGKLKAREQVDEATATLRSEGFHVSPELKKDLARFASKGAGSLSVFMSSIRKHMPKDPPRTLRDLERETPVDDEAPAEVMKYSQHGPKVFAAAKQANRDYDVLKGKGHIRVTREAFIAANVSVPS